MPAVLKIDPQRGVVCSTFHGRVTGEQLLEHRARILADPHFNPNFAEIVDFSAALLASIPDETLAALAGSKSLFSDSVPHVIVAPAEMPFALAEKYREFAKGSGRSLFVVRSLAEAYEVLRQHGYSADV